MALRRDLHHRGNEQEAASLPTAPSPPLRLTRRAALAAGGLAFALPARLAAAPAQTGLASLANGIRPELVARTLDALARHERRIWSRDVVAIVDFALPSSQPRLFLIDLLAGRTTAMLVAHGKGSDPEHGGRLVRFSNEDGSAATSEGAYLTGEPYDGVHGAARRLIGLDPTNDRADPRAIVIHAAWYVAPEVVARQGRLGRSDGCFAVSAADIGPLLARLGRGRLLYAG
ncbi:MAG: murein L,D-transpeptidase catalytic domain family protein [Sphingomonas sp.]